MAVTDYLLGVVYSFLVVFVLDGFYIVVISALLRVWAVISQSTLKLGAPEAVST